jgi:hypothetical protein
MNPLIHVHEHGAIVTASEAQTLTEHELLAQWGFTEEEIVSLLWLQQWYQMGGNDRALIVRIGELEV